MKMVGTAGFEPATHGYPLEAGMQRLATVHCSARLSYVPMVIVSADISE